MYDLKIFSSIIKKIMTQEENKKIQLLAILLRNKKEKQEKTLEQEATQQVDLDEHPFFEPKIFYAEDY